MSLENEIKALRKKAILEGDIDLEKTCDAALKALPKTRREQFRGPPKRVRQNPPLAEHMSGESYDDIYHALAQRIMQEPVEAIEFVYSVLDTAKEGLLRYSDSSLEESEESPLSQTETNLEKALLCIRKALEKLDA